MTKTFKAGDRVRVLTSLPAYRFQRGDIVTVESFHHGTTFPVKLVGHDNGPHGYYASRFELVIEPAAVLTNEQRQLRDLRKAAAALYLQGRWSLPVTDGVPYAEQAAMWETLWDALGFQPGRS